jgi:hypothetical protein
MNDILGSSEAGEGDVRSKVANHPHSLASRLDIGGRCVVQRDSAERLSVVKNKITKIGLG